MAQMEYPWRFRKASTIGLVVSLLIVAPIHATTFRTLSLSSNILIDGKRVLFTQGTGSLTVLDLDTGNVLLRKVPDETFSYSYGQFMSVADGILMIGHGTVLFDRETFQPIWQQAKSSDAVVDGEFIVSHDGFHTVTCRKIRTNEDVWSIDMKGGWRLAAAKGKVVVWTPYPEENANATLLVLDVATGHTVLRHEAHKGVRWSQVHFDGESLTLVDEQERDWSNPRPPPPIMRQLDLQGNVTDVLGRDILIIKNDRFNWRPPFVLYDTYFGHDGLIRPLSRAESKFVEEHSQERQGMFAVLPHALFAEEELKDADKETGFVLRTLTPESSWRVFAGNLKVRPFSRIGRASHVTEGPGSLLVGSTNGNVECFDIDTGRPRWIYRFPTITVLGSYSPGHGRMPTWDETAAQFQRTIANMTPTGGSTPLPQDFDLFPPKWADLQRVEYAGRIHIDPQPDDPFPLLENYRFWLTVLACLPAAGGLCLFLWPRRMWLRRPTASTGTTTAPTNLRPPALRWIVGSLILSILPAHGLYDYNLVSRSCTQALKVSFLMTIAVAAYGVWQLGVTKRWVACVVSAVILIGWLLYLYPPLWYG